MRILLAVMVAASSAFASDWVKTYRARVGDFSMFASCVESSLGVALHKSDAAPATGALMANDRELTIWIYRDLPQPSTGTVSVATMTVVAAKIDAAVGRCAAPAPPAP